MKQLNNAKEVRELREALWHEQEGICPLCNTYIPLSDTALDHSHDTGLIRGVLHKRCNSAEGTLKSKFKRAGITNLENCDVTFESFLINLHLYLIKDHYDYLHPSHKPGPKKLMKRSYNKLKKEIEIFNSYLKAHHTKDTTINGKRRKVIKMPEYPKSKKATKPLRELYERFGIEPEYYSN